MAGKKSREPKEFAEDLFKFIYNSRFDHSAFDDEDEYFNFNTDADTTLYNLMDGARSYDEVRNRIINEMRKAGNKDLIGRAVTKYNNVYGDPEAGAEGLFSVDLLPEIDALKMRALNNDAYSVEESLKMLMPLAQKLGVSPDELVYQVFGKTDPLTGMGLKENPRQAFRDLVADKVFQTEADARKFYRDMGYVYDGENNDDYLLNNLYNLAERVHKRKEYDNMPTAEKVVSTLAMPFSTDKVAEGIEPSTTDKVFDVAGAGGDALLALMTAGKSLPVQIGIGSVFGSLLKPVHDKLDLQKDKYIYSNGEGEKDIRADEQFNKLKEAKDGAKSIIPMLTLFGAGSIANRYMGGLGSRVINVVGNKAKEFASNALDRITGASSVKKKMAEVSDDIASYSTKLDDLEKMERQTTKEIGELNRDISRADKAGTAEDRAFASVSRKRVADKADRIDAIYEAKTDVNNALKKLEEQKKLLEKSKAVKRSQRALSGLELLGRAGALRLGESTRQPASGVSRWAFDFLKSDD